MNPFEMVVAIVAAVMIALVLRDRYRAQATMSQTSPQDLGETARMREELARLRERVQVLERVVTDTNPAADLDRRIERLRDQ